MAIETKNIKLQTQGETDIIDITAMVEGVIRSSKINSGTATVFVPGSTGGITSIEYEPGLISDLKRLFEQIAPKHADYEHNKRWGDGNGYSHVRAALLGPSFTVPIVNKNLRLGTWQQIVFIDFDNRPRSRQLIVQIVGE